jgi:pantetheine-phosphate adenylyltransferase
MKIAICPGSFDPVTKGHIDIITRASALFDKVIVVVAINAKKTNAFSAVERLNMLRKVTADLENVSVDIWDGLLADYARERGAKVIVKGLRAVSDFEYEFQMALANKKLYPEAETVFLTTASENMYLSSSVVKQIAQFGGDITGLVPEVLIDEIKNGLNKIGG